MKYGICHISTIPLRKDPSDRSEMVSQLLFGEHYRVVKEQEKWLFVETAFDSYQGWIDRKQFFTIGKKSYDKLGKSAPIAGELVSPVEMKEHPTIFPILMGSSLPDITELSVSYKGEIITSVAKKKIRTHLIENAYMYLNSPYMWGGRSPFGIDCSGFAQLVYKLNGVKLPRDAAQQATVGESLSFIEEARQGDLAFFDNDEGKIIHVGIMLTNNQIIHASGRVRIDKIDHQGIYNRDTRSYSHHLRLLKNILRD